MNIIFIILAICLGIFFGYTIAMSKIDKKKSGSIIIDRSDAYDGPYMFLELPNGLGDIAGKTYVYLGVEERRLLK